MTPLPKLRAIALREKAAQVKKFSIRSPLPPKTFQLVEFGAGRAEYIAELAKENQGRLCVAVDPAYKGNLELEKLGQLEKEGHLSYNYPRPKETPLLTSSHTMEGFIDLMKKQGLRTRQIHLRMPDPSYVETPGMFGLQKLFIEAKNILTPGGTIVITSDSQEIINKIFELCEKNKLTASAPMKMTTELRMHFGLDNGEKVAIARSRYEIRQISMKKKVQLVQITYNP